MSDFYRKPDTVSSICDDYITPLVQLNSKSSRFGQIFDIIPDDNGYEDVNQEAGVHNYLHFVGIRF